jgi:hypothetical protein
MQGLLASLFITITITAELLRSKRLKRKTRLRRRLRS